MIIVSKVNLTIFAMVSVLNLYKVRFIGEGCIHNLLAFYFSTRFTFYLYRHFRISDALGVYT